MAGRQRRSLLIRGIEGDLLEVKEDRDSLLVRISELEALLTDARAAHEKDSEQLFEALLAKEAMEDELATAAQEVAHLTGEVERLTAESARLSAANASNQISTELHMEELKQLHAARFAKLNTSSVLVQY